jgi:glycosyltransferase involved in cell wall biosynthesis
VREPPDPVTTTLVDCSGVGPGGITRMLTEVVRHWPDRHRLELFAVPPGWQLPARSGSDAAIRTRQSASRARTITSTAAALRRATRPAATRRQPGVPRRVLSLSPSLASVGSRLPVTTVVHDLAFRLWPRGIPTSVRLYRRLSYAAAIRGSQHLLCVSARTQHDLFGLYAVEGTRVGVWHPGNDLDVPPGRLPDELHQVRQRDQRYLVVAGHAAHKGVELAIDAVAADGRFVLAVLTGGQRVPSFERAAAGSPAAGRVLFLGRLSDEDYVAVVAGAVAFLMPSHFEGYGLPAAEAMRLGTPTIISPDPALTEATGGGAIRMDSWTGAALTRALASLDEPTHWETAARRSWSEAVAQLAALLDEVPQAGTAPLTTGVRV